MAGDFTDDINYGYEEFEDRTHNVCKQTYENIPTATKKTDNIDLTKWQGQGARLFVWIYNTDSANPFISCAVKAGMNSARGAELNLSADQSDITNFFNWSKAPQTLTYGENAFGVYNQEELPDSIEVTIGAADANPADAAVVIGVGLPE